VTRPSFIGQAIEDLHTRKEILDQTIAALERLSLTHLALGPSLEVVQRKVSGYTPMGRKSMAATERAKVSERMKRYWAMRKLAVG
jgi:hypothetical protein